MLDMNEAANAMLNEALQNVAPNVEQGGHCCYYASILTYSNAIVNIIALGIKLYIAAYFIGSSDMHILKLFLPSLSKKGNEKVQKSFMKPDIFSTQN